MCGPVLGMLPRLEAALGGSSCHGGAARGDVAAAGAGMKRPSGDSATTAPSEKQHCRARRVTRSSPDMIENER